jgi:hypothetical protein
LAISLWWTHKAAIGYKMKVKGTKKLVMMKTLKMERMTEMVIMNAVKSRVRQRRS